MIAITVWPSLDRPADGRVYPIASLVARIRAPRSYVSKDVIPRWAPAEFQNGYRNLASVRRVNVLGIDLDDRPAVRPLAMFKGIAHTTWRHTAEAARWRVVIWLTRSVTPEEHARVWRAAAELCERFGVGTPDVQARSAATCFALPAARPGYEWIDLDGAQLDVDRALERFPPPEPIPMPALRAHDDTRAHRIERASRYLATLPGAVSGSGGHAATWRAALALHGFGLDADDMLRLLAEEFNPRCAPS